jgi:hypothetical protein
MRRVPAAEIEALIIKSVREHLKIGKQIDDRTLVEHQMQQGGANFKRFVEFAERLATTATFQVRNSR